MAFAHIVVQTAAVILPLSLPCVVAAMNVRRDDRARREAWARRDQQPETEQLRALDRALSAAEPPTLIVPPLGDLEEDLQRLHRRRQAGQASECPRWRAAVVSAYDVRLSLVCRQVGVPENLEPLDGTDREIERVRIEGTLEEAGVRIRS